MIICRLRVTGWCLLPIDLRSCIPSPWNLELSHWAQLAVHLNSKKPRPSHDLANISQFSILASSEPCRDLNLTMQPFLQLTCRRRLLVHIWPVRMVWGGQSSMTRGTRWSHTGCRATPATLPRPEPPSASTQWRETQKCYAASVEQNGVSSAEKLNTANCRNWNKVMLQWHMDSISWKSLFKPKWHHILTRYPFHNPSCK